MNDEELFHLALEKPIGERSAFLDRACADDSDQRRRVEALLRSHETPDSFLAGPAYGPGIPEGLDLDLTTDVEMGRADEPIKGPSPTVDASGSRIGPYRLLQRLGEGGMGTVYMADQERPVRRKVAVKVIKSGMDSGQVIARFEAERQALALMDHVNIARVLDAGTTDSGRPYFVMELVHGVPITRYCDDNHLTPRQRLELFVPVCRAIQHAHQKGIIHRDIKPSNVMITLYDGKPVPKVIDFGVAKATEQKLTERTLFTHYGTLVGTLEYMSPEQAEMSALGVDTRGDVYSLGVLLYELLTGTTPLTHQCMKQAAFSEILRMIKEEEPPKPSNRLSDSGETLVSISARRHMEPAKLTKLVRGELDWIVMKALEKDRNRRYETPNDFAGDVQHYLNDEPVRACPPSAWYRLRKLARRHKGPVLTASLFIVALLVGIIGTTWGLIRATEAETAAVSEAKQKDRALTDKVAALEVARRSESDANEKLWLSLYQQARARRFSRQMGQRTETLDALAKASRLHPDDRLRDEAMAALALPDVRRGEGLAAVPDRVRGIDFDAHYQSYAQFDDQGTLSIRNCSDNAEIRSIPTNKSVSNLRLSPDGHFLAVFGDRQGVQLWRVADGEALLGDEPRPCSDVAFSSDSREVAIANGDWVLIVDVSSGNVRRRWRLPSTAHRLAFHPNERKLAVSYARSPVVSVYDSALGNHVTDLPTGTMDDPIIAWDSQGARLALGGLDPRIQIWDVAARRKLATLEGHVEKVTLLSFHPEGSLLASGSWDGTVRLWDSATGRQLMNLPISARVQFSSTGQLGYQWQGGDRMQMLEVIPSREYRTLVSGLGSGQGWYIDGDISPDGRLLAMGMSNAGDRVWDLGSGREVAVLPSRSFGTHFLPDGSELLTCGASGLLRWSIQGGQEADRELRLGPPRKVALPFVPHRAVGSRDGRRLAVVSERAGAGVLLELAEESVLARYDADPWVSQVALSRDDRWVASSGWHSNRARLWNAKTGEMIHEWAIKSLGGVYFTPDSRTLILCCGDSFRFWDVETLKPIRRVDRDVALYPGHVAFSPDGKLMALEMTPGTIHMNDVSSGRTVAKLEDPHGDRSGWMSFTPDGTQLVVAATYAKAIHVWNLRAMRLRLKEMGLDWDWPEFATPALKPRDAELTRIEVLRGADDTIPTRERDPRLNLEKYRLAVKSNPEDAGACNDLAWFYLTATEADRDANAALPLAEKTVRLAPGNSLYVNTLGVAYYRHGRYREAIQTLRPNLDGQADSGLAFDLYFLAMSHSRLGEAARARDYFDWAVRWQRGQSGQLWAGYLEELTLFHAEAEGLLKQESGAKAGRDKKSEPD